jgi:hypothetical protein
VKAAAAATACCRICAWSVTDSRAVWKLMPGSPSEYSSGSATALSAGRMRPMRARQPNRLT